VLRSARIASVITDVWPMYGLRLRTPRLELRLPGPDDLAALGQLAAGGVHDPGVMPFTEAWTDAPPEQIARNVVQYHWGKLSRWTPDEWSLPLVTVLDGVIIGTQEVAAHDLATLREVSTGSWLGLPYHGRGFGTEMRAAVLELAFAGLDAEYATTEAFADNRGSNRVSAKLGYQPDGIARHVVRDKAIVGQRLRLDRDGWRAHRVIDTTVDGLDACRSMFGLPSA
jgi:RimJ/RimL family protein N-acetyltransferase